MKTKLINTIYRGKATVDPRFSIKWMIKWIVAEIRSRQIKHKLSVGIENGIFEFVNDDFERQSGPEIQIKHIVGTVRLNKSSNKLKTVKSDFLDGCFLLEGPENGLAILLKHPHDPLLHIHLFESCSNDEMSELMEQMRQSTQSLGVSSKSHGSHESLIKLNNFGEQSTPASNLKLSESMRLAHHDGSPSIVPSSKLSTSRSTSGLNQPSSLSSISDIQPNTQFFEVFYVGKIKVSHKRVPFSFIDDALPKFKAYDAQRSKLQGESSNIASSAENIHLNTNSTESLNVINQKNDNNISDVKYEGDKENSANVDSKEHVLQRGQSVMVLGNKKEIPILRNRSASLGGNDTIKSMPRIAEQNRTMVFLIGSQDLRLISPDKKQILLYKHFTDVASCCQGHKNTEYFGIICRDNDVGYIGYVFKSQSELVASEIIACLSLQFNACSEQRKKEKNQIFSCEMCPMLWYSKLCADIEGLSEKKIHQVILRRIESLSEEDHNDIMTKVMGATKSDSSLSEQNQFLMILLRAYSENRQMKHVHDTLENRSEFLNQYLGGTSIFKKAKRSLSNSFDLLNSLNSLKRKSIHGKEDSTISSSGGEETSNCDNNSIKNENNLVLPLRSNSFGHYTNNNNSSSTPVPLKSPMMDIFIKIGSSPKEKSHASSWRQTMLNRVVTPSKTLEVLKENEFASPRLRGNQKNREKYTKEQLRELWPIAIKQVIILKKMECENFSYKKNAEKREKLDYDEIVHCNRPAIELWTSIISAKVTPSKDDIYKAIKDGVPKLNRGEVWIFLANQHELEAVPVDENQFPQINTPYNVLLTNLTEHQHAIFIDLGRTFPNLAFYKGFGVGQLGLFNLLKAYSNLDVDLGYCQGLGFICGILLLHLDDEKEAFFLLKHLMFLKKIRKNYLPDMREFQMMLYQFSRLLKDLIPDLWEFLDSNDITPTLYASPWFLTFFSSQFPLGFVVRIFDLLFFESTEVLFKVAIALLHYHKDELLSINSENAFEKIMDFLKVELPKSVQDAEKMKAILEIVFKPNFKNEHGDWHWKTKLTEYEIEYNVLQEELTAQNYHVENMSKINDENKHLQTQLQISENSRNLQKSEIQQLTTELQSLEATVQILGKFAQSITSKHDLEIPDEIKTILQKINHLEQQAQRKNKSQKLFADRKIAKSISVNSLSLALNVLEETNETEASNRTPKKFFGNTFDHIRQNKANLRLNCGESAKKFESGDKYEIDSGITTPSSSSELSIESGALHLHPLSHSNSDVNNFVRFNGTTQLVHKTNRMNRTVSCGSTVTPSDPDAKSVT